MNRVQRKMIVAGMMLVLVCAFTGADAHAADAVSDSPQAQIPETGEGFQDQNQSTVDQQNEIAGVSLRREPPNPRAGQPPVVAIPTWNGGNIFDPTGAQTVSVKTQPAGRYTVVTVKYFDPIRMSERTYTYNTGTPNVISLKVVAKNGQTYNETFDAATNKTSWNSTFNAMTGYLTIASNWKTPTGRANRTKLLDTVRQLLRVKSWVR